LHLPIVSAQPIRVLFGNNKKVYHSEQQAICSFSLAQNTFTHHFYILPSQLFPLTLGCDWFVKIKVQLHFNSHHLVLPNAAPIPLFMDPAPTMVLVNTQVTIVFPVERLHNLKALLQKFPSLFQKSVKTTQVNFPTRHVINTGAAQPVYMATRRRSPLEHDRINQAVQEMLDKGIVEPSSSEWVSEPHLVKKDDGTYRFCVDFRPLNRITVHDRYPLPRIDDLLDQLGQSKYFTSLDLASGYWQIPLDERDAHKTAFRTNRGLFQFKRMPFGLSNASSTFQRMANSIFQDLITTGVVLVYLDDILVHTVLATAHRGPPTSLRADPYTQPTVTVPQV
jgi:hypothetical protein